MKPMKPHQWTAVEVNLDAIWTCSVCGAQAGYASDGPPGKPHVRETPLPEDCNAAAEHLRTHADALAERSSHRLA